MGAFEAMATGPRSNLLALPSAESLVFSRPSAFAGFSGNTPAWCGPGQHSNWAFDLHRADVCRRRHYPLSLTFSSLRRKTYEAVKPRPVGRIPTAADALRQRASRSLRPGKWSLAFAQIPVD